MCSIAISLWVRCQNNARANTCHRYRIFHNDMLYFINSMVDGLETYVIIYIWLFLVGNMILYSMFEFTICLQYRLYSDATAASWRHKSACHLVFPQQDVVSNTKGTSKHSRCERNLCNELFLNLWSYSWGCVSLPFDKSCFQALSLQWRHMSVM